MADQVGLIVQGDEHNNNLTVNVVHEGNDDLSIHNIIYAGDGNDTLSGRPLNDDEIITQYGVQLFGEGGNDNLSDSLGDDTLSGGAGNDSILTTSGYDIIDGGEGTDTLFTSFETRLGSERLSITAVERLHVSISLKVNDFDLRQFDVIASFGDGIIKFGQKAIIKDVRFELEALGTHKFILQGSAFGDQFDLSASACNFAVDGGVGDDNFIGGQGNNNIDGRDGNDRITGGQKGDWLLGGNGNDVIFGGSGRDVLSDKGGNNTIHGGTDADDISASKGNSRLYGEGGNDAFHVSNGSFIVDAGSGDDSLYASGGAKAGFAWKFHGGEGEDTLYAKGNLSNLKVDGIEYLALTDTKPKLTIDPDALDSFDRILLNYGFEGMQIIFSSGGDFTWRHTLHEESNSSRLTGSEAIDRIDMSSSTNNWTIKGNGGNDVITGGRGRDLIDGGEGDDILTGSGGDSIYGGNGNDIVTGGKYDDTIHGGDGDDILSGSKGNDTFWGDAGKDTYVFKDLAGTATISHYDNSGTDRDIIDLSAIKSIKSFDDMLSNHIIEDFGRLTIRLGAYDVHIDGVSAKQLDESAFIF